MWTISIPAKVLLADSKSLNPKTPLLKAIHNGHKELIELLIKNGADVNAKDDNGETPLFVAIDIGKKELAELLIKLGAIE